MNIIHEKCNLDEVDNTGLPRNSFKYNKTKDEMLIVYEVHRSSSENNRRIYIPKWDYTLGLSATAFQGGTGIAKLCGGIVYDYNLFVIYVTKC